MCRLAAVHRVTQDVDTVTETEIVAGREKASIRVATPSALVADALRARVMDEPERAVRSLLDGGPEMSAVTANDLRDVLGPLIDRLAG